jgi:hypothetical protein
MACRVGLSLCCACARFCAALLRVKAAIEPLPGQWPLFPEELGACSDIAVACACVRGACWRQPVSLGISPACNKLFEDLGGGGLLHVDMFAHNKSGIAYRDGNRRSKTVVNHKREPQFASSVWQVPTPTFCTTGILALCVQS